MKPLHHVDAARRREIFEVLKSELSRDPSVTFAYLHGSFLEDLGFHDIDLGVFLSPSAAANALDHCLTLSDQLSQRVGLPVDVRPLNEAPFTFLFHVLRGELLTSRNDELLGDLMEETIRQYLDIAPLLKRSTREAFAS